MHLNMTLTRTPDRKAIAIMPHGIKRILLRLFYPLKIFSTIILMIMLTSCMPSQSDIPSQSLIKVSSSVDTQPVLRAELVDWATMNQYVPQGDRLEPVLSTEQSCDAIKEFLCTFEAKKIDTMLVNEAHRPEGFLMVLTQDDISAALKIIQNLTLIPATQADRNRRLTGAGSMVYLKQGDQSCLVTQGGYFTIWDSATNTKQMFYYTDEHALTDYVLSLLSLNRNKEAEIAIVPENSLSLTMMSNDFADDEDLARYRNKIRTLRASDINMLYYTAHGLTGEKRIVDRYFADEILKCLRNTDGLTSFEVLDASDGTRNPHTSSDEFIYLEWNGEPVLLAWDGEWLTVKLPDWDSPLIFDASKMAKEWQQAFLAFSEQIPVPEAVSDSQSENSAVEEQPWWVTMFSSEGPPVYMQNLYLHDNIKKVSYEMKADYDVVSAALAHATVSDELGKPWHEELSLDLYLESDDRCTIRFFESGIELTYSHWKLREKTTVGLSIPEDDYSLLKKRCEAAQIEGEPPRPMWLSIMNRGRIRAISVSDPTGKEIVYTYDARIDMLYLVEPYIRNIKVDGAARFVDKYAEFKNAYTVLVNFENGVSYTITIGEERLHIESNDVDVAVKYTLATPDKNRRDFQLVVDQLINPSVPYYDYSFSPTQIATADFCEEPSAIVEPSPESVILHIDKQQINLSDILKDPKDFCVIGYIINNSTMAVGRSTDYSVERYDGEQWQRLSFSRDAMPNWETGSGDIEPGERYLTSFGHWRFEEELIPGQYRFVMSSGPGFFSDKTLPCFDIYADFELL